MLMLIQTFTAGAYKTEKTQEEIGLPSFFSWQDIDGIDYTTPIKDQSPAPTCEAYGLVASLETIMQYQMEIYMNLTSLNVIFIFMLEEHMNLDMLTL